MCQERPKFDALCDCAAIILSVKQEKDFAVCKPEFRSGFMRSVYNGGADFNLDADCPVCGGHGAVPERVAA